VWENFPFQIFHKNRWLVSRPNLPRRVYHSLHPAPLFFVPRPGTASSCASFLTRKSWTPSPSTSPLLLPHSTLIFLQEIPPGGNGECRLKQLLRTMNGGNSLVEPRFRHLLGKETVVLDTSSQLNAIIYPAGWTVLQQASLTSFLHTPVMVWFKTPRTGQSTLLCASIHVSPLLEWLPLHLLKEPKKV